MQDVSWVVEGDGIVGRRRSVSICTSGECLGGAEAERLAARSQSTFCTTVATVGPFKAVQEPHASNYEFLPLTRFISNYSARRRYSYSFGMEARGCSRLRSVKRSYFIGRHFFLSSQLNYFSRFVENLWPSSCLESALISTGDG